MKGGPWLAFVEAFLVQKLLQSPAFHKAIRKAHKGVHRIRHGIPPEEMGGTNIDSPARQGFISHFVDELKGQAFSGKAPVRRRPTGETPRSQSQYRTQHERSPGADHNSQDQGFLTNFLEEIKDQFRGGNKSR